MSHGSDDAISHGFAMVQSVADMKRSHGGEKWLTRLSTNDCRLRGRTEGAHEGPIIPLMTATPVQSSALQTVRIAAADIKLAHSVFALPFATLAAFIAAAHAEGGGINWSRFAAQLALIVGCMFFARTAAMLANRLLDRDIDRANPRTAGRAIPSGRLSTRRAVTMLVACAGAFIACCAGFGLWFGNWWPLTLAVPVLAWVSAYGWFKRFTAMCHVYLGSSLAISPLAAAIAVDPVALADSPAIWLLAAMVLCWVAGFDVIYALQDVDVDRAQGLHSIPARFGSRGAMWISRGLHALAAGCLIGVWAVDARFAVLFGIGIAAVIGLLAYEHATVARWGTSKMALAFFTLNGIISCVLGGLGIADTLV